MNLSVESRFEGDVCVITPEAQDNETLVNVALQTCELINSGCTGGLEALDYLLEGGHFEVGDFDVYLGKDNGNRAVYAERVSGIGVPEIRAQLWRAVSKLEAA